MLTDLRYAFRQLFKAPAFTITTLLTLALGIGACTAIFSVANCVLLRPLTFPDSARLVQFWETKLPQYPGFSVAPGQYFSWKEHARSFESLAARHYDSFTLTGKGNAVRITTEEVSASYFDTFRVHPALGREFRDDENIPGHEKVVIVNHGFWMRQFGGETNAVGRTLQLNGETYAIIGVMPANFKSDWATDLLSPITFAAGDHEQRGGHFLNVVGRLRPNVSIEQARSEMLLIADQDARQYPESNKGWSVGLSSMLDNSVSDVKPLLFTLLGAVGFLLLIGCVNVANLLLARAATRSKEIAIRVAQGATRRRIVRQLLTESVLLAALGGTLGAIVAHGGVHALVALAPGGLPRGDEISVDGRALGFAVGLILLTGLGFGLIPALQASRVNLNETLKDAGRGASAGGRGQRLLGGLVIIEIAMALALLTGAGLLIRSFARLKEIKPGFEPARAVTVDFALPPSKYSREAQQVAFAEQMITQLAALPNVQAVGATQVLPFSGRDHVLVFKPESSAAIAYSDWSSANYYVATPDYFKAMGIPLLRGRFFDDDDRAGSVGVAIVNESLAKQFYPHGDALGKKIMIITDTKNWKEIVGIVADAQHYRLDGKSVPQMYEPFSHQPSPRISFVVRSRGDPPIQLGSVRAIANAIDPEQPIINFRRLDRAVSNSILQQRFSMQLFAVFSGAALLLAIIGIYGVMSYAVTRRTGEIGIRMALGAQQRDVLKMVFLQGCRLVALGLTVGLVTALLLTRFISSLLYSVSAYDPLTFMATVILLATVATLACLIPAYRATKVNPLTALQTE